MSGGSSSAAWWSTRLEAVRPDDAVRRYDDPRLGEVAGFRQGIVPKLRPGQAALLGFPTDEGVRRNHGRPGAAEAPREVRRWLYRLPPWDFEKDTDLARLPPLDLGDVRTAGDLEADQTTLGEVIAAVLAAEAVPVVLGGGHETAYGHFLGYVFNGGAPCVLNLDAHLDVRPCLADGRGHSGSPFRQALEHPTHPLPGSWYACYGVQPHAVSRTHWEYARAKGCLVRSCELVRGRLGEWVEDICRSWESQRWRVYLSLDADVVHAAEVPGVSAPNVQGFSGGEVLASVRLAGRLPMVSSFDLVEINPRFDVDGRSARWAALAVWHFLMGLAERAARP